MSTTALGPVRRFAPDVSTAHFVARLARQPVTAARRVGELARELGRAGVGASTVAPSRRDRWLADPAWGENPILRRLVQGHLAGADTLQQLVADADLDWRDEQRVRFLVENLVQVAAPSNVPLVNPASAQAVIDTGGVNLLRGAADAGADRSA
jgi:polyhydroxyalkanoate synthase subunit PhaC